MHVADLQRRVLTGQQIDHAVRSMLWPRSRLAGYRRVTRAGTALQRIAEKQVIVAVYMLAGHKDLSTEVH